MIIIIIIIRVSVGLRLGANICEPHPCPCGSQVDCRGLHGLVCKKSSGRISRHQYLNDLIWRALIKAGVPAVKEPSGLCRNDGKRPDGMSQIPWVSGKCVVWDVTVSDTLASSYLQHTSVTAGSAAENAADKKIQKYSELSSSYMFVPIAFETLGPINSCGADFIRALGSRAMSSSGDHREASFLWQRLSMAVQRFNAACLLGTFESFSES